MNNGPNTVFLRLEGPLQAWGDTSKFVIRRTMEAPTKSGVIGLVCCAMGLSRDVARERLSKLNKLVMGVRIDRSGTAWWDYHTVGAKIGLLRADGKGIKYTATTGEIETLVTRREYLCDASFLVALQGDPGLVAEIATALGDPKWPVFLGRKSCPPSVPVLALWGDGEQSANPSKQPDLVTALKVVPWRPRYEGERLEEPVTCLVEWRASEGEPAAPVDAEIWYDVATAFGGAEPQARFVLRKSIEVSPDLVGKPLQYRVSPPPRARAAYSSSRWRDEIKPARLERDHGLCVFCKSPATTVQHVTYRRAGGDETQEDLRSLCRLCHDAVTMIEYGLGMGLDRINPEDSRWRNEIIKKRDEIRHWRGEEGRRRALRGASDRVRRELLEEGEE